MEKVALNSPGEVDDAVFRRCLDWYATSKGRFALNHDELEGILPFLQLHAVGDNGSKYLYCGAQSVVGDLYGQDFCVEAQGKEGVPDSAFEQTLNRDYWTVTRTETPIAQRVRAPIDVYGTKYSVEFFRYVFPVKFREFNAVGVLARFAESPILLN
jgi:hypothetical protein